MSETDRKGGADLDPTELNERLGGLRSRFGELRGRL